MLKKADKGRFAFVFRKLVRMGLGKSSISPFEAAARIMGVSSGAEHRKELFALYETVRYLRVTQREDILRALSLVYLTPKRNTLRKSEISMRVLRCAQLMHCDERTVYRYLKYAISVYEKYMSI